MLGFSTWLHVSVFGLASEGSLLWCGGVVRVSHPSNGWLVCTCLIIRGPGSLVLQLVGMGVHFIGCLGQSSPPLAGPGIIVGALVVHPDG